MKLGFFTMPIHPVDKDWRQSLREDREAFLLADELGFSEGYVGEHVTDQAENITSCVAFIAWLAAATKRIKLGTGTINMPNTHPAIVASSIAMLDHMLDGRLIFGISPGGLLAVAGWVAGSAAFTFYVSNFSAYNKTYGTLGGMIVFLIWLWISNVVVLLGAELNAVRERGRDLEARDSPR